MGLTYISAIALGIVYAKASLYTWFSYLHSMVLYVSARSANIIFDEIFNLLRLDSRMRTR